jgi:hypothetical protein
MPLQSLAVRWSRTNGIAAIKKAAQRAAQANLYRISSHSSQMKRGEAGADGARPGAGTMKSAPPPRPSWGKPKKPIRSVGRTLVTESADTVP